MDINSDDYHDFVIKEGKLIGEFDQMYQKSKDIPWHQNNQKRWLDIRLTLELLYEYGYFDRIVDLGCGLGYFLDILCNHSGIEGCGTIGFDISETCCKKAKELFPYYNFQTINLMEKNEISLPESYWPSLFSIRGTLWYVFPKMKQVVENINNMTNKGDLFLISQNFPPLNSDFVGKDVIPNPEAIIKWFEDSFTPLETVFLQDHNSEDNSNWFIGIFRRK